MRCCVSTEENLHLMMVKTPDGLPLCFSCSFLNILPFAVSSSVALLHQQHHMQFFFPLCLLPVEKSTKLALFHSIFSSIHSSVWFALTPTWAWQTSASISAVLVSVSVEWQPEDREAREWWMAVPLALSFPFPDRSPLIAFPGLGFAGNGLKHDMSLTRCLQREREGVP